MCNTGLKLLQIISKTSQGWQQISAVHAGWQSIVAGTIQGDALVHDLPGEFNNPGEHPRYLCDDWAVSNDPGCGCF